jgi:hypothetical protein
VAPTPTTGEGGQATGAVARALRRGAEAAGRRRRRGKAQSSSGDEQVSDGGGSVQKQSVGVAHTVGHAGRSKPICSSVPLIYSSFNHKYISTYIYRLTEEYIEHLFVGCPDRFRYRVMYRHHGRNSVVMFNTGTDNK